MWGWWSRIVAAITAVMRRTRTKRVALCFWLRLVFRPWWWRLTA